MSKKEGEARPMSPPPKSAPEYNVLFTQKRLTSTPVSLPSRLVHDCQICWVNLRHDVMTKPDPLQQWQFTRFKNLQSFSDIGLFVANPQFWIFPGPYLQQQLHDKLKTSSVNELCFSLLNDRTNDKCVCLLFSSTPAAWSCSLNSRLNLFFSFSYDAIGMNSVRLFTVKWETVSNII